MAMVRESAFMPTITCSSCGGQVEISMMGEHICPGPSAELSPPPDSTGEFEASYNTDKYGRSPPRLDTGIAGQSYMHRGQLTPISNPGGSRSASPASPTRQQWRQGGEDTAASRRSPVSRTARPGGYGGFGLQDGSDLEQTSAAALAPALAPPGTDKPIGWGGLLQRINTNGLGHQESPESEQKNSPAPQSADKPIGWGGLLQRMNSIAPGPFEAKQKPSIAKNANLARIDSLTKPDGPDNLEEPIRAADRPGTSHSNKSATSNTPMAPPKAPRKNGYGGFGAPASDSSEPQATSLGLISRSDTFPKPTPQAEPTRRPSVPGLRTDRRTNVSPRGEGRRPSAGPDTSRIPPPRISLIPQQHKPGHLSGSVDLAAEFGVSNPYHTPSGSGSSGYSNFSDPSLASSQTSPARSQKQQDAASYRMDRPMDRLQSSMENLRPNDVRIDASIQESLTRPAPQRGEAPYVMSPREERNDPAIQNGRFNSLPQSYDRRSPQGRYGSSPQREPGYSGATPLGLQQMPPRKDSRDASLPSRGDCKACGLAIRGKSVSSADGRLTGKYHKACFVCTTCSEPFSSAEFYVLNDKPYCEQHYHKLNGSLCGSCGRGIEGQYLEDEERVKYHVGCFQCLDCGRSLSEGYFEVNGKSYCERDAFRRVQQLPIVTTGIVGEPESYQQPPPPRGGPGLRPPPNGRPRPGPRAGPGGAARGGPRAPYGIPPGTRAGPGMSSGMGARPQMNKRMTRLGMM